MRNGSTAMWILRKELDACLPELRHWEWGYLKRLCHLELTSVKLLCPTGGGIASVTMGSLRRRLRRMPQSTTSPFAMRPRANAWNAREVYSDRVDRFQPRWQTARHFSSRQAGHNLGCSYGKGNGDLSRKLGQMSGSVAFSPDGKQVASGDRTAVKIWAAMRPRRFKL